MMKGYLDSEGIFVSEPKIAKSLERVAPDSFQSQRHNIIDRTNPHHTQPITLVTKYIYTEMKN